MRCYNLNNRSCDSPTGRRLPLHAGGAIAIEAIRIEILSSRYCVSPTGRLLPQSNPD